MRNHISRKSLGLILLMVVNYAIFHAPTLAVGQNTEDLPRNVYDSQQAGWDFDGGPMTTYYYRDVKGAQLTTERNEDLYDCPELRMQSRYEGCEYHTGMTSWCNPDTVKYCWPKQKQI